MNINQHFSNLATKAAEEGTNASQLITQRDRLFKDKVIPELVKRGANDAAIAQARLKFNNQTDTVMANAGLLPKAGQSSQSFAKDKRADKAIKESARTGSQWPIIKESAKSFGDTVGNVFGQGVGGMIEGAAGFINDIGENEKNSTSAKIAKYGKNLKKGYENSASTFQKELQAGQHGKIPQLSTSVIQSAPALALPFGVAKGATAAASKIPMLASQASKIGLVSGTAAGHTQNYGEVRRNATANLERDFPTWEKLQGNPLYQQNFQKLLDSGVNINQARQQAHAETLDALSEGTADKYGSIMTALDFIAPSGAVLGSGILKNAPTSKIGKALVGGGVSADLIRREMTQAPRVGMAKLIPDISKTANIAAAKMVGKQALEEGLQGGIGEYGAQAASANIGGQAVDYGKVGQTFLEEGLIGGIMGGGMQSGLGGSPTSQAKEVAKQLRNQTNALRQEEAAARSELAQAMQFNDAEKIQSAQSNLQNIGIEANKVKAAYGQYGIETPYFVERFASQYQPQQEPEQQGVDPTAPPTPEAAPQAEPVQPTPAAQPAPVQPTQINKGMASTTNLVMDSVTKGLISPEEAQAIQTDPIRAEVFSLVHAGDQAAAHNIVMNAVSLGNIDMNQAQNLIESIPRYTQLGQPQKPSLSGIVNDHVKQQIQPQAPSQEGGLFSNAVDLDPSTLEPIDQNQPSPFQEDFNEPKQFMNPTRASDYVRDNGLADSHELVRHDDGVIEVRPRQNNIPEDPNLNDFGDNPAQNMQPVAEDPNLTDFSDGAASVADLADGGIPEVLPVQEDEQAAEPVTKAKKDFSKPKIFSNAIRAKEYVKENHLEDTHEIINLADGRVQVQLKAEPAQQQANKDDSGRELSNAEQITGIFSTIGNAFASASIGDLAEKLSQGKRVQYFKPASIEAAKKNLNYHVADNEDGSADIIGVRDDKGVWHGQAPKTDEATTTTAPSNNPSFAEKFRDAHLNNPSIKPRLINDEIDNGRSRPEVLKEASEIVKSVNDSKPKEPELEVETDLSTSKEGSLLAEPVKDQKTDENGIQENDAPDGMKSGDIGRGSDGKPFLSKNAANRGLKLRNVENTHEVVEISPSNFVLREKSKSEDDSDEATPVQPTESPFQKYDELAKQYGRSVKPDGSITKANGQDTQVKILEKKGRLHIEDAAGKLLFSGAQNPESLGKFLEDYWYDQKNPAVKAKEPTAKPPEQPTESVSDIQVNDEIVFSKDFDYSEAGKPYKVISVAQAKIVVQSDDGSQLSLPTKTLNIEREKNTDLVKITKAKAPTPEKQENDNESNNVANNTSTTEDAAPTPTRKPTEPEQTATPAKRDRDMDSGIDRKNPENTDNAKGTGDAAASSTERSNDGTPTESGRTTNSDLKAEVKKDVELAIEQTNITQENFKIDESSQVGEGDLTEKFNTNIEVIKLINKLDAEQRQATPTERALLARYVGWGGLSQAFSVDDVYSKGWEEKGKLLKSLMKSDDYDRARRSTTSAFFTPPNVVKAMWKAVEKLGYQGGLVIESSVGVGNFLGLAPSDMQNRFIGAELDGVTARIAQHLYPQEKIFHAGYEQLPINDGMFDLAIGNPPYGSDTVTFKDKPHLNGENIHNQFMLSTIENLKANGLSVQIVSHSFMDAKNSSTRNQIAKIANLVGALRLPPETFKDSANTQVITDILIFQKRTESEIKAIDELGFSETVGRQAWVESGDIRHEGENVAFNPYFDKPGNVLGEVKTKIGKWGAEYTIKSNGDTEKGLNQFIDNLRSVYPKRDLAAIQTETENLYEQTLSHILIGMSGLEIGAVSRDDKGQLFRIIEQETDLGYINKTQILSPDTVWSKDYIIDKDGNHYKLEPLKDENGKTVKVKTAEGKDTNKNVYGRVIVPVDKIASQSKLGEEGFKVLSKLTDLRDVLREQLNFELSDHKDIEKNRKKLRQMYESFVAEHGYINSDKISKLADEMPDAALMFALEAGYKREIKGKLLGKQKGKNVYEVIQPESASPADILNKRVVFNKNKATKADSVSDGVSLSLAYTGRVDLNLISELTGKSKNQLIDEMHNQMDEPLIYQDPELGQWVTAQKYLSGNVRQKIKAALNEGLSKNVEALEKIVPDEVQLENITLSLGMHWIPPSGYKQFATHITGDQEASVTFEPLLGNFEVEAKTNQVKKGLFGTENVNQEWLLNRILNNRSIRITKQIGWGRDAKTVVDQEATELAIQAAETIKMEFSDWVYSQSEIADSLKTLFNEKFNNIVQEKYDGSHLQFIGKVPDNLIELRTHQVNAVWRGITNDFVLYDHAVGSGKTFTGIARAMERKRLGLSKKPVIVVPNHMVDQFSADVYRLYPAAKVLAAGKKDFEKKNRKRLFAKIATGDYDIIVVPHSSFEFVKLAPETEMRYMQEELDKIVAAIKEAKDSKAEGKRHTVKQLEETKSRIQAKLERKRATKRKDKDLTFEQMGIDDITVDEAHEYKNLFYHSNLSNVIGMGTPAGSGKAFDLHNKFRYLHENGGSGSFMTGTPISNSAVEMHTMMRYLMPDVLKSYNLERFDNWAKLYADNTTKFEATESGQLKQVSRFARDWKNMRSLMDLWYSVVDPVTNEDVKADYLARKGEEFPLPEVEGGGRQSIVVQPTRQQEDLLKEVLAGYDELSSISDTKEKNATRLRLMDKARKVSLDARAVDPTIKVDKGGKLEAVANKAYEVYKQWDADKGTQIIFLDRSVPKSKGDDKLLKDYDAIIAKMEKAELNGDVDELGKLQDKLDTFDSNEIQELRTAVNATWNAYDEIKNQLVAQGIPANEIRFVQEAKNDAEKQDLFNQVKSGEVRIIIGSTPRMGAGTNIQDRLVHLHHVDVTWKPSDIEQREGRIIRQGNKLYDQYKREGKPFKVGVTAYVTERTTDAKLWDVNSAKLKTINGIRHYSGDFNMDFGQDADNVSMQEIAALASGNPLMLERVTLDAEIQQLNRLKQGHNRKVSGIQNQVSQAKKRMKNAPAEIASFDETVNVVAEHVEKAIELFEKQSISIDGQSFNDRKEAEAYIDDKYNKAREAQEEGKKVAVAYKVNGQDIGSMTKTREAVKSSFAMSEPLLIEYQGKTYSSSVEFANEAFGNDQPSWVKNPTGKEVFKLFGLPVEFDKDTVTALTSDERFSVSNTEIAGDVTAMKLSNAIRGLANSVRATATPSKTKYLKDRVSTAEKTIKDLEPLMNTPFSKEQELAEKQERLDEVIKTLSADNNVETPAQPEQKNSRRDNTGTGSTPAQVRTELVNRFGEDVISQLEQQGVLAIVESHSEQGVEGFAENGKVTLVADAITPENIVPVFLHELGGHVGMQGVLKPSAYENLMSDFDRLVKAGNPDALEAKRLAERETDQKVQKDEYLPYLITVTAKNQQKQSAAQRLVSRVLGAVKAWAVHKLGLNLKLNSSDIVALAERMVKTVSKGTPPTGGKKSIGKVINENSSIDRPNYNFSIASLWSSLAKDNDAFEKPISTKKDLKDISLELSDRFSIEEFTPRSKSQTQAWILTNEDGRTTKIFRNEDDVWIDISNFSRGGGGKDIYNIVSNYAYNNNLKFAGDPNGLSGQGMTRRLENMLTSAVKFGTTRHLKPHQKQLDGNDLVIGMNWIDGDDMNNLEQLMFASYNTIKTNYPEIQSINYNPEKDIFEGIPTGRLANETNKGKLKEFTRKDMSLLVSKAQANPIRIIADFAPTAGATTIERAILMHSYLTGTPKDRLDIKERLSIQGSNRLTGSNSILFSRKNGPATTNNSDSDLNNTDIRYSRSSNPANMSRSKQRELLDAAAKTAFGQMSLRNAERAKTLSNRTLNLFQTMLHKSLTDKSGDFKKTFDLVQGKINHVTFASTRSMDVAPNVLTQLEEGSDYWKEAKRVGRTLGNGLSGGKIEKAKIDKDLEKIGTLLFENTLLDNSERHTDKELRQLGFDGDQIGLYNEVREAIDTSLDTFANTTFSNIYKHLGGTNEEVLELEGLNLEIHAHYNEVLKRINALTNGKPEMVDARQAAIEAIDKVFKKANDLKDEGYVPLMRFGKYFVRIYNPTTGEVAYRQHFESESERNMYYRKHANDDFPAGFEMEQGRINELQHKLFQGVSPETVALFAKESGLPIGDAEKAYIKFAVKNNHALKRLLRRQGIDGFDTDLKRVLAAFVMSNARYSANQTYNPAIDDSILNIKDPAYQEDAIRLRDYSLDTQEELAPLKNFAFVYYMGFSAMFGVVNLTQPFLQTLPFLMQYTKDHGTIFKAMGKAITTWRKGTDAMDQKYKAHYERARKEGHLDPQNTWMMQGLERGKSGLGASTWQLFSHASGMFAQASETVNRRTTLFAALDVAESMGQAKLEKLGFKNAYDFAVRTIQETQGIYNKGNRPRVARGNIGSVLMMYKQFMISYIEQMSRMQKSGLYGGEDDEFKKKMAALVGFGISRSVLVMLGILMSVSGATGLPFVRDILDGIETAGGLVGKPVNTEREVQIALHDALGQTLGSAVNTALMDGFVNLNPLIDVKGRMGMGDLIPATAYFSPTTSDYMKSAELSNIAGPMGGLLEKVKESVALAQVGAYGQAGMQLLPKAGTSLAQGIDAAVTGDYRNMKTGVKTNDATVLQGIIKTLDAQPAGIAKEGRIRGLEMKDKAAKTAVNARWKERYEAALDSGERASISAVKQEIKEYNQENPRYPVTFNKKTTETNYNKSNQKWQDKRKDAKGLEWMDRYNPYLSEE